VSNSFYGLDENQILSTIPATANAIATVEVQHSGNNTHRFLCYSAVFPDKDKMQQMMCFALPALFSLLFYTWVSCDSIEY
jgi:hypothetical protein